MAEKKYSQFRDQPRLPKFAVPKRYDLKLKPDLVSCKFSGSVEIDINIVSETKFLVLNAADLVFDRSYISFTSRASSKELRPSEVEMVEEDEIAVLEFGEALEVGEGSLRIDFDGTLNDRMKGFYRSTYEYNGEKKNMAVTQFEPADARRCFPCWDEPAAKATFKITLEVPSELMALSNMPVAEEKHSGHLKTVSYQESPIMSTYLVAVVVGLFDYVEDQTSDGVKVRVYCQLGKANQGKFALDVAVKTLGIYKEYFATPYTLPKLDMIAIPDFAAGAMENYGLVTYRETALLYDDKHSAAANKQRVAIVVAHELAHQWFGNLVTMEWWTHLWLNEGFATWVSYLAADDIFPEWKIWTQFLDQITDGLTLDGLAESHPIEVEVRHASEIDEIFDAISYRKGASVIRMLQSYLGPQSFQRGLASYIKRYACANAKTEDLWAVLEEESGEPVNMIMHSWTKQTGYPVVSVKTQDQSLEFEQNPYLNPRMEYDVFSDLFEVKRGLYNCMDRLLSVEDRDIVHSQLDHYLQKGGLFGRPEAIKSRHTRTPGGWWGAFGDSVPELKKFAIKVLNLTCSSSACERNWSTFNHKIPFSLKEGVEVEDLRRICLALWLLGS